MELSLINLFKEYKRGKFGLRDFSLEIRGGILGLLGPNGAGKSTLMRIIATISQPTKGKVLWNGIDIAQDPNVIRSVLGYLPQDFGVYSNLDAVEFLEYIAAVKGVTGKSARQRIDRLLDELNLDDVRYSPLSTYSGGMKQRIGIAQALLNDPKIIIMDEPSVGLDPAERVRFRNFLADLAGERIIILSSHTVSEVEAMANNIVILKNGSLLEHGTPDKMLEHVEGKVFETTIPNGQIAEFKERHQVIDARRNADGWHIRFISGTPGADQERNRANPATPVKATLEDAYLWFTSPRQERQEQGV
jgi:ABC-type multidrug transport system ATPase subunit